MQPALYDTYKNDENSEVVFWLCFSSIYYIMVKRVGGGQGGVHI